MYQLPLGLSERKPPVKPLQLDGLANMLKTRQNFPSTQPERDNDVGNDHEKL